MDLKLLLTNIMSITFICAGSNPITQDPLSELENAYRNLQVQQQKENQSNSDNIRAAIEELNKAFENTIGSPSKQLKFL